MSEKEICVKEKQVPELLNSVIEYFTSKEYEKVIEYCNEILKKEFNNIDALYFKGYTLDKLSRYEEAIECYNKALVFDRYNINALNNKGWVLYQLNKCEEAIEYYDKVLAIDQNNINALSNKGWALNKWGKHDEALECFDKILTIDKDNTNALNNKGWVLYQLGECEEAIEYYDKALAIDQNNIDALINKGWALNKWSKHDEAIECFDKTLSIDKNNVNALDAKGWVLYQLGRNEEAIIWYDKALAIDPNNIDTLSNKFRTLFWLGRYDEAIEYCDKILSLKPNNIFALGNKGWVLNQLGKCEKCEEALECYEKALAIDKNNPQLLNDKGLVFYQLGDHRKASGCYDQILLLEPDNIMALVNKSFTLSWLSEYKDAIKYSDKALALKPDDILALSSKAVALSWLGRCGEAVRCYDEILRIEPNNVEALTNKGWMLDRLYRRPEALECYDKALEINEDYEGALCYKGITLHNSGRYEDAIDYLEKVKFTKSLVNSASLFRALSLFRLARYDDEDLVQSLVNSNASLLDILANFRKNDDSIESDEEREKLITIACQFLEKGKDIFFNKTIINDEDVTRADSYRKIYVHSLRIVSLLHVNMNAAAEEKVAHYTKKSTAECLLFKDQEHNEKEVSKLRLSTIAKANDPHEGKTLLSYLGIDACYHETEEYEAFISCFTFNHESLNQFRLYGKEDSKEATGVSLVVGNGFFKNYLSDGIVVHNSEKYITNDDKFEDSKKENNIKVFKKDNTYPLFRCVYIDPKTCKVISVGHREDYTFYRECSRCWTDERISDYKNKILALLENIRGSFDALKKEISILNQELMPFRKENEEDQRLENEAKGKLKEIVFPILSKLLINLRYLVKHVAFKEEQECRIISVEPLQDNSKITVEKNRQMYIESTIISSFVSHIYFAPLACDYKLFRDRIYKDFSNENMPKCRQCDHPFNS